MEKPTKLNRRRWALGFALTPGLGLLLLAALLWGLHGVTPARADPSDLFVTSSGSGDCTQANPCDLQTALGLAADGDTVYAGAGTYTGRGGAVVTVTSSITLYGGWDGTTATPPVRDPGTYATRLDGENARRVVHVSGSCSPTIDGFTIMRGRAVDANGGGVYVRDASPIIRHNVITANQVITGFGGGLYLSNAVAQVISNTVISNSTNAFVDPWDHSRGGGLYVAGAPSLVSDNLFSENVSYWGGAIHIASGSPTIQANQIVSNTAASGGGIRAVYDSSLIQRNAILGNNAYDYSGGGIYLYDASSAKVDGNVIVGNGARTYAGGIASRFASTVLIVNNVIAGNGNEGIYLYKTSTMVVNNTIVDNGLTGHEEGILIGGDVIPTIVNNIVVSHAVGIRSQASVTPVVDYNDVWNNREANYSGVVTGTHDISTDPQFVDAAGGDYHLRNGSPCIDAGTTVSWLTTDLDSDSRPRGVHYDIGADEFWPQTIYLPLLERNWS
jgi:parallel beta-helix repeat protein